MAKTKTFAEKMLKSMKPTQEFDCFKVIRAKAGPKGAVRFNSKIVQVKKGSDENAALGIQ